MEINLFERGRYLCFWMKAHKFQGVHSPFVYKFVINCWRNKVHSFNSSQYSLPEVSENQNRSINKTVQYFAKANYTLKAIENIQMYSYSERRITLNNHQFVVIHNIRTNATNRRIWIELLQEQTKHVCLDMYYFTLVIRRDEQAPQKFKIK